MTKAAIYCRVSTETQAMKGYSLGEQYAVCSQYMLEKGYTLVESVQEDISGTKHNRPKMNKLIDLARNKAIDVIVCLELDRFARGPVPMVMIESQFQQYGVKIEYVQNQFEDSPLGEFMKTVSAGIAELERQKIIERMMRGKNGKARSGKVVQGPNPSYGYYFMDNAYHIDEEEAVIVRKIYKWYLEEHLGYVQIAKRLTAEGVPTRSDSNQYSARRTKAAGMWNMSTIRNILSNRVYIGELSWGRGRKDPIVVTVPAIVEPAYFEAVQTKKKENTRFSRRNAKLEYLLTGMLYCKTCGERFYGMAKNKNSNRRYYRCGSQVPDHKPYPGYVSDCPQEYLKAEIIEAVVWDTVATALQKPELITEQLKRKQKAQADELKNQSQQLEHLRGQIRKIAQQEQRLLNLYLENSFDTEVLRQKGAELKAVRIKLEAQVEDLAHQEATEMLTDESIQEFEAYCRKIAKGLNLFTLQQKRNTLKLLQIKACIDKRDGSIEITGLLGDLVASYFGYMQYCLIPKSY